MKKYDINIIFNNYTDYMLKVLYISGYISIKFILLFKFFTLKKFKLRVLVSHIISLMNSVHLEIRFKKAKILLIFLIHKSFYCVFIL